MASDHRLPDVFVLTEVCSPQPPQVPRWWQEPNCNVLEDLTSLQVCVLEGGLWFAISGVQLGPFQVHPESVPMTGQGKCESLETTENFHIPF